MKSKNTILFLFYSYNFTRMLIANFSLIFLISQSFSGMQPLIRFIKFGMIISFLFYLKRIISEIYFFKYDFKLEEINIKKGVFHKKSYAINYKSISGANWYQPYFFRLFNVFKLDLLLPDTGDNRVQSIPIITKKEREKIDKYIYKIPNSNNGDEGIKTNLDEKKIYKPVSIKKIVYSSFVTLNYLYVMTIYFFISDFLEYFGVDLSKLMRQFTEKQNKFLVILLIAILSCLSSVLKQFISFSKYKLYDYGMYLEISNGIVKNASMKIKKAAITGLVITCSLGQALMKLSSVKAIVLNAESEDHQIKTNYILPYQKEDELKTNISLILPEFKMDQYIFWSQYTAIRIIFLVVLCMLNLIIVFHYNSIIFLVLLLLFDIIVFVFSNCCLTKVSNTPSKILISTGIISRKNYLLNKDSVEWIHSIKIGSKFQFGRIGVKISKLKKISCINFR